MSCKVPGFMHRPIGPTVLICGNSGLPFTMVPCFHQRNLYIKMKLRKWRAQKCNPCFGAKTLLRSTRLESTQFHALPYRADSANLWKFGATFRHGTVIAPKICLYQREFPLAALYRGGWEVWVWWPVEVCTLFPPTEGPHF